MTAGRLTPRARAPCQTGGLIEARVCVTVVSSRSRLIAQALRER